MRAIDVAQMLTSFDVNPHGQGGVYTHCGKDYLKEFFGEGVLIGKVEENRNYLYLYANAGSEVRKATKGHAPTALYRNSDDCEIYLWELD